MAAPTLNQPALRPALNLADLRDKAAALVNLGLVNENGDLVTEGIDIGGGTAAELAADVGAMGELLYATDTGKLAIGDGVTTFVNLPWINADAHNITILSTTATLTLPDSTAQVVRYTIGASGIGGGVLTINLPHANALGQRVQIVIKPGLSRTVVLQNPFVALDYGTHASSAQLGTPIFEAPSPGSNNLGGGVIVLEYVALSNNEAVVTLTNLATADFDNWVLNNNGGGV